MKETEMMLNDWVLADGEAVRVTSLDGHRNTIETEATQTNRTCEPYRRGSKSIQPMPMTDELLEAIGLKLGENSFENKESPFGEVTRIVVHKLKIDLEELHEVIWMMRLMHHGISIEKEGDINIKFQYFHQLQHILRIFGLPDPGEKLVTEEEKE